MQNKQFFSHTLPIQSQSMFRVSAMLTLYPYWKIYKDDDKIYRSLYLVIIDNYLPAGKHLLTNGDGKSVCTIIVYNLYSVVLYFILENPKVPANPIGGKGQWVYILSHELHMIRPPWSVKAETLDRRGFLLWGPPPVTLSHRVSFHLHHALCALLYGYITKVCTLLFLIRFNNLFVCTYNYVHLLHCIYYADLGLYFKQV